MHPHEEGLTMRVWFHSGQRTAWGQGTVVVLAAAFLFNLGQGVLRPTLPLYTRQRIAAAAPSACS